MWRSTDKHYPLSIRNAKGFISPLVAKRDPIVLKDPICETAPGQPAVIYTGAVYGALKKKDRGLDIKTGLFMEASNTWVVVWMHTIKSVSLSGVGRRVVCVRPCLQVVSG